jgi:hypothetical protein
MNLSALDEGTMRRDTPNGSRVTAWQRTDTVGTELVFCSDPAGLSADGTAVVAGSPAYTSQWHANLNDDGMVCALTVTCRGSDWSRTLWMSRAEREWTCRTEETGDLTAAARRGQPPPGIEDPARLDSGAVVRLAGSPIFVSWAVRGLRLAVAAGPVSAPAIWVCTPSLAVVPGGSTYQLLSEHRLRVTGEGVTGTCDLDDAGFVTHQPGKSRLVR